jgi:hypothetical protein
MVARSRFSTETARQSGKFIEFSILSPQSCRAGPDKLLVEVAGGGNMGLRHMVVMAFLAVCVCLPLAAQQVDNVTFNNSGGMLSGTGLNSGSLSLNSSTLSGISGFTGPLGGFDTTGSNLGTLSFTTGPLSSGSMVP